ncbi:MAG: iron-containing alcohol dehydrogenase [Candidatus Thorarchaeota archaeon]|nr:iron-containing alcohol dehydrogenase [Candidatus Thorarchaeota archaeon]
MGQRMVWWFDIPKVAFGEDALEELAMESGKRAVIITDKVISGLGLIDSVKDILERGERTVTVWDGAEPDPRISIVKDAAAALKEANADMIVAVGGGSVMDTAKAAWILYENPNYDLKALNPFDALGLRDNARLYCIPTTAGTGSEATRAVVIREDETGRKFASINPELIPDMAILDPKMVERLPRDLTAYTGMDALTHAVEAFISIWKNPFSDAASLQAIQLVFEWLPKSVNDLGNLEAREKMLVAANLAGMAFSNSQVCLAHSLGHSLGSVLRVHHGLAVGMALPLTIEFAIHGNPDTAAHVTSLASLVGITGSGETAERAFAERIRDLQRQIGFPLSLREAGISKTDFEEGLDKLVEFAMMDSSITMTPRDVNENEIREIYNRMYEGTRVDF